MVEIAERIAALNPPGLDRLGSTGIGALVPGASWNNVTQCALVLEDFPVGFDSSLRFESFQQEIDESYTVHGYEDVAGNRMPQPLFVKYRGGNWNVFNLVLNFRAGEEVRRLTDISIIDAMDLEAILIEMERKVRWCQALAFPLPRRAKDLEDRVESNAQQAGLGSVFSKVDKGQLIRHDPPKVLVAFGSFLVLRCYVMSVTLKWQGPWHPVSVRPFGCEVQLSLMRIDKEYPSWFSIRHQAGKFPPRPIIPKIPGNVLLRQDAQAARKAARFASNNLSRDIGRLQQAAAGT